MNLSCKDHLANFTNSDSILKMIIRVDQKGGKCSFLDCQNPAEFTVHYNEDKIESSLPDRKIILTSMVNELTIAAEKGALITFSAEDKFERGLPVLTKYTFIVNKEMLVNVINSMNQGK